MKNNITTTALGGLTIISVVSTLSLSSVSATDTNTSQDNVTVSVPVSCTMNGTGMTSHNANIPNGTYQADIGTTTLKTFCNDNQGFAIYAIGYTNEEYGNTTLIGATGGQTIVTGTATTTGSPDVSNWAVKLATDSTATYPITLDNSFGAYSSVPSTYTKVAHRDSGTDLGSSATGASLTTTYAAYISKTQQADTYNGEVKYTLVHPADHVAPVICNSNATTIDEAKCLQDFASNNSASIINSMEIENNYFLKDKRDGKTYSIAKLANNEVWMTKNLDLDLNTSTTYTNEDTDIGYNTSTGQYDLAAWSPIRSTYSNSTTYTAQWCQGGVWSSEYGCEKNNTPESYDPGELYWNGSIYNFTQNSEWEDYLTSCNYSSREPSCNQSLNPISNYTYNIGLGQYHLGNYYNWSAAIASNDSSAYGEGSIVNQSICPAGWTLPAASEGEHSFYDMWIRYGYDKNNSNFASDTIISDFGPVYYSLNGFFNGVLLDIGDNFGFWSSYADNTTGSNGTSALIAYMSGYVLHASYNAPNNRANGSAIRCIARSAVSP